jgi:hypothetical protein
LKKNILEPSSRRSETPTTLTEDEDDDGEDITHPVSTAEDDGSNPSSSTAQTRSINRAACETRPISMKRTTAKSAGKIETEILNQLSQRAESSRKLQNRIEEMMETTESSQSSRVMWGKWMNTMMKDIHEDL